MKILVLSGSRNRKGQTARAVNAICRGVLGAGENIEVLFLTECNVERCRQCDEDGWGTCRSESFCVIDDDFAGIVDKVEESDAIVFANPVYFGDLCESMKAFLDRFRRIRFFNMIAGGRFNRERSSADSKTPVLGICYAGGSGNGTTSCCANLEHILKECGFDVVDMIPVRRQNIEAKLPILELTGKWLARKPTSGPSFVPK